MGESPKNVLAMSRRDVGILETAAAPLPESTQRGIFKLCRAIGSLKRKEAALWQFFGNEEPSLDEISDLIHAVLLLCELPEDVPTDGYYDFFDSLTEESNDADFRLLVARVRALAQIESIEFSLADGSIENVVPPEKEEVARALFPRGSQSY